MTSCATLVLDHVLNPDHDALAHSAVFSASDGNLFCVHCASERYERAPDFRRLALLDGISCILRAHGPQCLRNSVGACIPMLLHGIDSAETGIVQAATDLVLALKEELPDPMGVLSSLISSTLSLGLPRASGHLYLVGQLLISASHDRALAITIGNACMMHEGAPIESNGIFCRSRTAEGIEGSNFGGFASFLAAHAVSSSCPDHVKSDVIYVAMELLDCCATAGVDLGIASQALESPHNTNTHRSFPPPGDDPFVCVMLAIPRLLARRSSCDEPLQLHSVAYLATATAYCCQRVESGVPGWSTNTDGVPEVLVALFDGSSNGTHELPLCEKVTGGNRPQQSSSDGLCNTLKALLMSSSYRVRSATARLIASLCNDAPFPETLVVHERDVSGTKRAGRFFREALLSAGATDFLFEAIKTEQEGTRQHYLEATEALTLSPVEFFHADNFSMKFAAPILLAASKGQRNGSGSCSSTNSEEVRNLANCTSGENGNEAREFAISCRLLLQALIAVPPSSSAGIVEELLATAAVSTRSDMTSRNRAIGVAADVLSLITSGDIDISKARGNFIDAVEVLLDHLEKDLVPAARPEYQRADVSMPAERTSSSIESGEQLELGAHLTRDHHRDGGFILQVLRVMENLLHITEEWMLSQEGCPGLSRAARRSGNGAVGGLDTGEDGIALANLVFGTYERTVRCQHNLVARSKHLAHSIAFMSCMGAAVDVTLAVAQKRGEEAANGKDDRGSLHPPHLRPSFLGAQKHMGIAHDHFGSGWLRAVCGTGLAGATHDVDNALLASMEPSATTDPAVAVSAACLEAILRMTVDEDIVSWLLDLHAQCDGGMTAGVEEHLHRRSSVGSIAAEPPSSQSNERVNGDTACCTTPRELLAEVLQSLLYAQGWVSGLCTDAVNSPLHGRQHVIGNVADGGRNDNVIMGASDSTFGETICSVLQSWSATGGSGGDAMPMDQYIISLLGTSADNGDLCKVVALIVSLSPCYLGILHPHQGCRANSAVTLLQYVKTVPEIVFCLNLFSHVVLMCGDGGRDGGSYISPMSDNLSTAIKNVLARFPVADLAFSMIPLSTAALSFVLRAGSITFVADWLIAAPLCRIRQVLNELGAPGDRQHADDTDNVVGASGRETWLVEEGERTGILPTDGFDQEALAGILEAAVCRWGSELRGDLYHCGAEATVYRLSCVLLMSPDVFLYLAFMSGFQGNETTDRRHKEQQATGATADTLGAIIIDTLQKLSSALLSVVLRRNDADNNNRTSKLNCVSKVSQLASAFLRVWGVCSCDTSGSGSDLYTARWASSHGASIEVSLTRACGGLLQGVLDPRRRHGSAGGRIFCKKDSPSNLALLSVFNLLSALLVLWHRDSDLQHHTKERRAFALQEAHEALLELSAPMPRAIGLLLSWFDHASATLAAFLQVCVIWSVIEFPDNADKNDGLTCKRLDPPHELVVHVLLSGSNGSNHVSGRTKSNCGPSKMEVLCMQMSCPTVLQVLAARCVESVASVRPFSRQQVLALQLALQGNVCDGSSTLASASLGAIQALWKAYAGALQPNDLVGQSWNSFIVECCLQNALQLLASNENSVTVNNGQPEGGKLTADLRTGQGSKGYRVGASMLLSAVGRLLHWSVENRCLGFRSAVDSDGSGIEILSSAAAIRVYQCATLLATDLRLALDFGTKETFNSTGDHLDDQTRAQLCHGDQEQNNIVILHLSDALVQLVRVLMCIEPPHRASVQQGTINRQHDVVDAFLRLHRTLLASEERSWGTRNARLGQVPMSLLNGAYQSWGEAGASYYEGVFFVQYDYRRALPSASELSSRTELAVDIERLIERLSGSLTG